MKIRRNTNPSSPTLLPASHSPSLSGGTAYSPILPALNPQIPSQFSSILPPLMKDSEPPNSAGETSEAPPPLPAAVAMEKVDVLDAEKRIDGQAETAAAPSSQRATEGNEPLSEAGASAAAATQPEEDGGEEKDGMAGENRDGVDEGSVAKEKEDGVAEGLLAKDKGLELPEGGSNAVAATATAIVVSKKKGTRTSCYHGVTRHKWTRKYEAHLYDRTVNIESRKRKGKQVYLGGYDSEEKAARAYDLGALKYWGVNAGTKLNFPISDYEKELVEMERMNQDEWVASLRRRSSGFSRGVSVYRGVARRKDGKWQARVGTSVSKTKDIYLGAFNTEEEAAIAYDIAIVELRGRTAITNFDISNYFDDDLRLEDLRREEAPARLKL